MAKNLETRMAATANTPAGERVTLHKQVSRMEGEFAKVLPRGMEATQIVRDAQTVLSKTPQLANTTPASFLGALMTSAQLGLRPGVLGESYILPFKDTATFVIGYQGLIELMYRSGKVSSVWAETVYEADHFDYQLGDDPHLTHRPDWQAENRGNPIGYYAVVKMTAGDTKFKFMSHAEMLKYKSRNAKSPNYGPWKDNFEAMAHKTLVRQIAKWIPKSTELARAIEVDGSVRLDTTETGIDNTQHIEGEVVDTTDAPQEAGQQGQAEDPR